MAHALREDVETDSKGRKFRIYHAAPQYGRRDPVWANVHYASNGHMERSFQWRRQIIVDTCVRLKTDIDAYNDFADHKPFNLILDFEDDVAEREEALSLT